jgi:GNAT superfamily N-acetyltransferase
MSYLVRAVWGEDWEQLRELRLAALADPVAPVAFTETYARAAAQDDEFWKRRASQGGRRTEQCEFPSAGPRAETFVGVDEADGGRWAGSVTVLDEGGVVRVVGVYLRPEHRGTGLAAMLFHAAEEWARALPEARRMLLNVHEGNPRAESFYRRIGYVRTGNFEMDVKAPMLREYEMARELVAVGEGVRGAQEEFEA